MTVLVGTRPRFAIEPGLYELRGLELAAGYVFGRVDLGIRPRPDATPEVARQVFGETIRRLMADGRTCFVAFSGGRDSSIVLAVATRIAREEGLAPPVALTRRYPGVAEAEESEYQELVIRHLGLDDWIKVELGDEVDLLSPVAQTSIVQRGVLWPPAVHREVTFYRLAAGGNLLTGEGGDSVFETRRITPLRRVLSRHSRTTVAGVGAVASALVPSWWRMLRPSVEPGDLTWVRPPARREIVRRFATEDAEPLRWDRAMIRDVSGRGVAQGLMNLAIVADQEGCRLHHPLLDPGFVAAAATVGGILGRRNRNEMMRSVFGGLLPDSIMYRNTKATFNATTFREHSHAFVQRWDGTGLDDDVIDVDELRRHWAGDFVSSATYALLQAAWLATEGGRPAFGR